MTTAENFYWAGDKTRGRDTSRYYRRNPSIGATAFSWDYAGNWFIKTEGYTAAHGGGNTFGYYFEDATRTPRGSDNVFFTRLDGSQPGIEAHNFFPTTECLFGGITGPLTGGGTWGGEATGTTGELQGFLNLVEVDSSYYRIRQANFALGNEFGSTFGNFSLGNSASIVIGGMTGLSGNTGNLIFTNTDGTTVEFVGSTFYGVTAGGQYPGPSGGLSGGTYGTEETQGKWIIGTSLRGTDNNTWGKTAATLALFNALRAGISGCGPQPFSKPCPCDEEYWWDCLDTPRGPLKMQITGFTGDHGITVNNAVGVTFVLTQMLGGDPGNTKITGSILSPNDQSVFFGVTAGITLIDPSTALGYSGGFTGGTSTTIANELSIRTTTINHDSAAPVHLVDSGLTRGFVLNSGQFNFKRGTINQIVYNRRVIDYLGDPQTASYITDTEFPSGSVVISGGTFQHGGGSGSGTITDFGGERPITYIRASGGIENVVVDAFRRGSVVIDAEVTTSMEVYPEKNHPADIQGSVEISRPIAETERFNYPLITMKSFNPAHQLSGSTSNNKLILNSGLTIGQLDIEAGTVSVGQFIADRPITVSDGSISGTGVLKARSEFNPSYTGFRIGGDDFPVQPSTGGVTLPEGILIYDPDAKIEFSAGHYVLATFLGNTGSDEAFQKPGSPLPPKV
tara:strand:+ start:176 stop:2212 length:2037 start_codon:yes stop_codon:yes gene_type:complete